MENNTINGFVIEENIPLLTSKVELYNKIADTLIKIEVKQSFFVQIKDFDNRADTSIRLSIKNLLAKTSGVSFSMKKVKDEDGNLLGYRFWKIAESEVEEEEETE